MYEKLEDLNVEYVQTLVESNNLTWKELKSILLRGRSSGNGTPNESDLIPPEMPEDIVLWLTVSRALWWYVVFMSFFSLPLYGYALAALASQERMKQQLCFVSIVIADLTMLFIMGTGLVLARFTRGLLATILCKLMIFTSNIASFYSNWCWVLLWGRRYLAVFYPLKNYQSKQRLKPVLLSLFIAACVLESWTLVYTTEYDFGGISFCDLDADRADYGLFKWIVLAEALLSYGIPFILTMAADLSVICRSYAAGIFTMVTSEELNSKNGAFPDAAKILPRNYRQNQLRRKHRSIVRCILAATLDIGLNFPDYTLQLVDNFVPLRELLSSYKLHYGLEALAYILYICQYPLIVLYVRLILKDFGGSVPRTTGTNSVFDNNNAQRTDSPQFSLGNLRPRASTYVPPALRRSKFLKGNNFSQSEENNALIRNNGRTIRHTTSSTEGADTADSTAL